MARNKAFGRAAPRTVKVDDVKMNAGKMNDPDPAKLSAHAKLSDQELEAAVMSGAGTICIIGPGELKDRIQAEVLIESGFASKWVVVEHGKTLHARAPIIDLRGSVLPINDTGTKAASFYLKLKRIGGSTLRAVETYYGITGDLDWLPKVRLDILHRVMELADLGSPKTLEEDSGRLMLQVGGYAPIVAAYMFSRYGVESRAYMYNPLDEKGYRIGLAVVCGEDGPAVAYTGCVSRNQLLNEDIEVLSKRLNKEIGAEEGTGLIWG